MPKSISKYDDWKTSLPDEPEPIAFCDSCGAELYEGDYLYIHSLYIAMMPIGSRFLE